MILRVWLGQPAYLFCCPRPA